MTTKQPDGVSASKKEILLESATSPAVDSLVLSGSLRDETGNDETDTPSTDQVEKKRTPKFSRDYRFWMIMCTLVISTLLASLGSTVMITSLPTIVEELNIGSDYIWVTNVYFLTRRVVPPSAHLHPH